MRRIDSLAGALTGAAVVAAIVIIQAEVGAAKQDVLSIARSVTVQINGTDGRYTYDGSGVIIAKRGNTYTVATNHHVVCEMDQAAQCQKDVKYSVQTPDGQRHAVAGIPTSRFGNYEPDLTVVYFNSPNPYPVATLGNSDQIAENDPILIYGYPGIDGLAGESRKAEFSDGSFIRKQPHPAGYNLRFSALASEGMSGSPVFDARGRVVGIFGRRIVSGIPLAIPINSLRTIAPKTGLALSSLRIDNTPNLRNQFPLETPTTAEEHYIQGLVKLDKGNSRDAMNAFTQALKLAPNLAAAYNSRGFARNLLEDEQGAIADYTQALKLDPQNEEVYGNRGIVRDDVGDYRGAIADYTQALKFDPTDADTLYNRALAHGHIGDYQRAIADYTKALSLKPNDAEALNNRGNARNQMDDVSGALRDYTEAIQLNPKFAKAYSNRGGVRSKLGDYQGAIVDCDQAIQLNPKLASAYAIRGGVRLGLGNSQVAIADLQKAANLYQQEGDTTNHQAMVSAIKQIQQALSRSSP